MLNDNTAEKEYALCLRGDICPGETGEEPPVIQVPGELRGRDGEATGFEACFSAFSRAKTSVLDEKGSMYTQ